MSPRILYRTLAIAEVITWALLLTAMFLKYVTKTTDMWVSPAGGIHGFVFLSYGAMTIFVWINQKWKPSVGILGLVSAVVPFATLPFDIAIDKRGLLNGGWRLAPERERVRRSTSRVTMRLQASRSPGSGRGGPKVKSPGEAAAGSR